MTLAEPRRDAADRARPAPVTKISLIISKGALDMVYPGLILANAARMSGIDATLFFTFWGLDVVTEKTVDHLHAPAGNPAMDLPTYVGGLPGMESLTATIREQQMATLDPPPVREMLEILHDSGAKLFACQMAMDMFKRGAAELVPEVDSVITAMDFYDECVGAQILFI